MATKKKTKKKRTESKIAAGKKTVRRKLARKNTAVKAKANRKKTTRRKTGGTPKRQVQRKSQSVDTVASALEGQRAAGEQSGDLQGLSNVAGADSESVDELLEEGNAFEAEAVKGVEDAGDADEGEVHTHEGPQDGIPGERPDKD